MKSDDVQLSLVVPMYNEAEGVDVLFSRLLPVVRALSVSWEIVCVDDGSRDNTVELLRLQHANEPRIKLVRLSRNFGKEAALTAGLAHAAGQMLIPLDADLQDPPEMIPEMIAKWQQGAKMVIATRRYRHGDGWLKRITAALFYRFIQRVSDIYIPANTGDFRLMDRQVVDALLELRERTRFMKGLFSWVGFPTEQVYYDRPERAAGETKFRFMSLWRLALDGIFSFTTLPLKVWTYLGAVISLISFTYAVYLVVRTLTHGADVPGYASLMVAVLFLGGIQLISLGIIGEYIGRIYRETKQRPLYVVHETLGTVERAR